MKSNGIIISFAESFGIETKKNIKTSREFGQTKEKQNKKKKSPVTSFPDEFKTKTPLTRCERERESKKNNRKEKQQRKKKGEEIM